MPVLPGSLSGLLATWPMTATMLALRSRLPSEWFTSLPPRRITLRAAKKTGLLPRLGWREREAFTWVSHFGFGAAAGAVYGALADSARAGGSRGAPSVPAPPATAAPGVLATGLRGAAYGLGVWAAAYLGLMPALGLHPIATRDKGSRNRLMIASHLVWGACLALLHRPLRRAAAEVRAGGPVPAGPSAHEEPALPIGHTAAWESREGSPAFD